jgi:hypothetical protein
VDHLPPKLEPALIERFKHLASSPTIAALNSLLRTAISLTDDTYYVCPPIPFPRAAALRLNTRLPLLANTPCPSLADASIDSGECIETSAQGV